MIFIAIVFVAIVLYLLDYRVLALIIFFFFITSGFNLIPEEVMDIGPISKGGDFAFFTLAGIVIIDSFCRKNYLKVDDFSRYLLLFGVFLVLCIAYSKWILGASWMEIFRPVRYYFFWIAYFVFRSMKKEALEQILRILFIVVVCLSVLFLLQILLNTHILNEAQKSAFSIGNLKLPRFYNQPETLQFFVLVAIYRNPYKNVWKRITTAILVLALLGAFHRSLMGWFVMVLLLGYLVRLSRLRRIQVLLILGVITIGGISFAGVKLAKSRTFADLQSVAKGNFIDVETTMDVEELESATFTFRLALFYERNQYILEHPRAMLLGVGLMPDESPLVDKLFDFDIGLVNKQTNKTQQLETGDMSYCLLILQLGYLGAALFLAVWIYLAVFFYKHREHKYGLLSFLYIIFALLSGLFSSYIVLPINYIMPLITYSIIKNTNKENLQPEI
jgi:hypothetical protein